MTDQTKNAAPDTPEMKAVGALLAAMHDNRLDGAKVREAMLWALGAVPLFPEAAQEAPLPVAWQVRRTDGSPLATWESCTKDLYDLTLKSGRYCGFENGPPCEVRALSPASARPLSEMEIAELTLRASGEPNYSECLVRLVEAAHGIAPSAVGGSADQEGMTP